MKISSSGTGIQYPEGLCFPSAAERIIDTNIGARLCVHCPDLGARHATHCSRNAKWEVSAYKGRRDPVKRSVLRRLTEGRMLQVEGNYMV